MNLEKYTLFKKKKNYFLSTRKMHYDMMEILQGKTIIVGIGNPMRGDDGFGPALIKTLVGKIDAVCIDAGNAPENFTGVIKQHKPDTILVIDAVHLDLVPGEYRFINPDELAVTGFSTHAYSLTLFIDYVRTETSAMLYLLGIQPKTTTFNAGLSSELQETLATLSRLIIEAYQKNR